MAAATPLFIVLVSGLSLLPVCFTKRVISEKKEAGPSLPTIGAWKYDDTVTLARKQLGKCIRPELAEENSFNWLLDLQTSAKAAVTSPVKGPYVESQSRPLSLTVKGLPVGKLMPFHRAVILTSDRLPNTETPDDMYYPDSRCLEFDYTQTPGSIPDPHGCGLFWRSFSRLKTLRQCITGTLDTSPMWQKYLAVGREIRAARTDGTLWTDNPLTVSEEDMDAVKDQELRKDINDCATSGKCVLLDSIRRADEMIKYLGFKDWSQVADPLQEWVKKKVRYTASFYKQDAPEDSQSQSVHKPEKKEIFSRFKKKSAPDALQKQLGLEDDTINNIVGTCFNVSSDSYDELPEETKILQRSLSCNSIMWDSVQVPGMPQAPLTNAATMWDPALKSPSTLQWNFTNTPPVCGRAAAVLAGWPQVHAKKGYSKGACHETESKPWAQCTKPKYFNCVCFEKCWVAALRRVCELTPDGSCCGDEDQFDRIKKANVDAFDWAGIE